MRNKQEKSIICSKCPRKFASEIAAKDHLRDKHTPRESMSFFEMQEAAWYNNDCNGAIESYDGSEF